jgi:hypothetical protein
MKKSNYGLGMVEDTCNPSNVGGIGRRIPVQASLGINMRPYLKNKAKKGWGHGSSCRVPA